MTTALPPPGGIDLEDLVRGVIEGDRGLLARAITLVESQRDDHRELADELLTRLMPRTGGAHRLGITGVPGAGKSTFIEAFGCMLIDRGKAVAVLAVDPTSAKTRGSILGDKTRMHQLARSERAFVRPSPSGGSAGGVAGRTREAMLVLEAAGYDVIIVETVGVGQSETLVSSMVDFVLLLALAGAGDELQGIKRGILEWADLVAIHKADGDGLEPARRARSELESAMRFLRPSEADWRPPVLLASAREGAGLEAIWSEVARHRHLLGGSGALQAKRQRQQVEWFWTLLDDGLRRALRQRLADRGILDQALDQVRAGRLTPAVAAHRLLRDFTGG